MTDLTPDAFDLLRQAEETGSPRISDKDDDKKWNTYRVAIRESDIPEVRDD